jgi:hypothetical protein
MSCKKDTEPYYMNWEEVVLGRGIVDVKYLRRTDRGLLVVLPTVYIRFGRNFQDGTIRFGLGADIEPNSNSKLIVDLIDETRFSVFAFDGELNRPIIVELPKINDSQLRIVASYPMVQSQRVATPFAVSPHNENTDTTHVYYFGRATSGYFLIDQPVYIPRNPVDESKGYLVAVGSPQTIDISQYRFNTYSEITYHKGFLYMSNGYRINASTGFAEKFESSKANYITLASPANDTIFGITYQIGSSASILLMKASSNDLWDNGFSISLPAPIEAIGKVGSYIVVGFNSQPCFINFETKKAKVLALGNLPKNRVISGIAEFNGYVYIGYRSGGLFKKPLSEVKAELSRIP